MNNIYHPNRRTNSLLLLAFMVLAAMMSHRIYAQGDLELIGIEVNQCIQDWNNSVELVEGKRTYVRVHLKSLGSPRFVGFTRLRGFRNGIELPGSPLTASNANFSAQILPNRGNWFHTLNFVLPQSWTSGTVTLKWVKPVLVNASTYCKESAGPVPNDCNTTVTFLPTAIPKIRFIGVKWYKNGIAYQPNFGDIFGLKQTLTSIFPIHHISFKITDQWIYSEEKVPNGQLPDLYDVLAKLYAARTVDISSGSPDLQNEIWYGALKGHDSSISNILGVGYISSTASVGYINEEAFDDYRRFTHAHEVAHNLGRRHTRRTISDNENGFCGEEPGDPTVFPYTATIDGRLVPTIGPGVGPNSNITIYGIEQRYGAAGRYARRQQNIIEPTKHFELMSYCGPEFQWISDYTYENIRAAINARFNPAMIAYSFTPSDYIMMRGMIDINNNTVSFDPFLEINGTPEFSPPGIYSLLLKDEAGNVTSTISFQPKEITVDYPDNDPGLSHFIIPVPNNPNIKKVEVKKGNLSLGSISASANAPTVTVSYPNGGEYLSGNQLTLQWQAFDADMDVLSYTVQYSIDAGATWNTLTVDHPNKSLTIDRSDIPGTSQGLIRVIASDGFHSATDQSNTPFTTPNNAPDITLLFPVDDESFFEEQPVYLEAFAYDAEQGELTGSSISWKSNKDGFLGTGEELFLTANQLSVGTHIITATATDVGGLTDAESITIHIGQNFPPYLEVDAGDCRAVYKGYTPEACTKLEPAVTGGIPPYTFLWSNGLNTPTINVCPVSTTTYTVTVTDATGLEVTDDVSVIVVDVRCGNNQNKVLICHTQSNNANTLCISPSAVPSHLDHGDYLGPCGTNPCPTNIQPLIILNANLTDEMTADLYWVHKSELQGEVRFVVERSTDSVYFEPILELAGESSQRPELYRDMDRNPQEGNNFYRLKTLHTNGSFEFSNVEKVVFNPGTDFTVFPNPASNQVNLYMKRFLDNEVDVIISNTLGSVIYHQHIDKVVDKILPINISQDAFKDGIYLVSVIHKGKAQSKRFVVARF